MSFHTLFKIYVSRCADHFYIGFLNFFFLTPSIIGILKKPWSRSPKKRGLMKAKVTKKKGEGLMKAKVTKKKGLPSEYEFIKIYRSIYMFSTITIVSLWLVTCSISIF